MAFTPEQVEILTRASTDFTYFVNHIFSLSVKNFIKGEHIDNTARFLSQNRKTITVSARNHFKSFSFYAHFMWKLMFEGSSSDIESHYFSFNADLAAYHIGKIKRCIEANPYFEDIIDAKPTAESVLRYSWDYKHYTTLEPHGLVQFKRGIHGDLIYVDDPFQDPDNELRPVVIYKINEIFKSNILDMPKDPDGELHVCGCLAPDSIIQMGDGSIKELSDVKENDYVIGYDFKNNVFIPKRVLKLVNNGRQDLLKIKVQSGKEITSTKNHPYLTREGWKETGNLTKEDYVALPTKILTNKKHEINEDEAELIGYVLGDGSIGERGGFGFCGLNENIHKRVKELCKNLNLSCVPRYNDKTSVSIGIGRGKDKSKIREKYNLEHCNSHTKEVPAKVFRAPKKVIGAFLRGLFETDGSFGLKEYRIGYGSVSKKLFFGVHSLLLQLGIHSNIHLRRNAGIAGKTDIWELSFSKVEDINRFLKITGAFRYKFANEYKKRTSTSSNGFVVPLSEKEKELAKRLYFFHSIGAASIKQLEKFKEFDYLTELDIYWAKVKDIKKVGKGDTLNLTIDDGNFIANGILTHNTPQTKDDFFFDKAVTQRFEVQILPAIYTDLKTGAEKALWPEWMTLEELYKKRGERTVRIFNREYMCMPVFSTKSFFNKELLKEKIVNKELSLWKARVNYEPANTVIAGFDIGKKTHPSHLSVFEYRNDKLIMVHEKWMDGWSYSNGKKFFEVYPTQLEYLKMCIQNFKIKELRYDNTRGEFEAFAEQGLLPREMTPVVMTTKTRNNMATAFDRLVEKGQIELPNEDRLINQICVVTDDLEAMPSKEGHGDSFWSVALAISSAKDLVGFYDDEDNTQRHKILTGQHSIFSEGSKAPAGW